MEENKFKQTDYELSKQAFARDDILKIQKFFTDSYFRDYIVEKWIASIIGALIFIVSFWVRGMLDSNSLSVTALIFLYHLANDCTVWGDLNMVPLQLFGNKDLTHDLNQIMTLISQFLHCLNSINTYVQSSDIVSSSVIFGDMLHRGMWGDCFDLLVTISLKTWIYSGNLSVEDFITLYGHLESLAERRRLHFSFLEFGSHFWPNFLVYEVQPLLDLLFNYYGNNASSSTEDLSFTI